MWPHLPAIVTALIAAVVTIMALPLPDTAPIHFDISGKPNEYGSPWLSSLLLLGLSLFYIILSIFLDELWARQEKRKMFNWLSLFDEVTVGVLAAIQIMYIKMLESATYVFVFPWPTIILICGLAIVSALILEKARPFHSYMTSLTTDDTSSLKTEISKIIKSGQPLVYWELQNPAYVNLLAVLVPIMMFAVAITSWAVTPWVSILMILVGIGLSMTYGGFRTLVTQNAVTVKMGILGIRLLQLKTADIAAAEVYNYSPLHDFGGYGIRFNREMKAYFLRGTRGVKLTSTSGKKYLIGSDNADRLATIISSVSSA